MRTSGGDELVPVAILVESVRSAITLFVIPIFPFMKPCTQRLAIRLQYAFERPNDRMEADMMSIPNNKGSFLPI